MSNSIATNAVRKDHSNSVVVGEHMTKLVLVYKKISIQALLVGIHMHRKSYGRNNQLAISVCYANIGLL